MRLNELAEIFAASVGGFSVMDNHLHLLLRLDSLKAEVIIPAQAAIAPSFQRLPIAKTNGISECAGLNRFAIGVASHQVLSFQSRSQRRQPLRAIAPEYRDRESSRFDLAAIGHRP